MTSVWELESFYAPQDVIIAGGGFAGLWTAYHLKKGNPKLNILVIEKNLFPTGASTRNAGFSCFGSVTELMDDAKVLGTEKMLQLVRMRYDGLQKISKVFSSRDIKYKQHGGYELITEKQYSSEIQLADDIKWLNDLLVKITGIDQTFKLANNKISQFNFQGVDLLVENKLEGQLHPGLLVQAMISKLQRMDVRIMMGTELKSFQQQNDRLLIHTNAPVALTTQQLLIATNGLTGALLPDDFILPARGQVLVTSPIRDLPFKGTFHYDEGFYYFRNLGDRVLLGGARNLAFKEERTSELAVSDKIQHELERFLKEVILPGKDYSIEHRWSGIMGMGSEKFPIIKEIKPNCFCFVALGGMGVALAPVAGKQVAELMLQAAGKVR